MTIIELSELQFKNYAKIHSARNIYQTIEYANLMEKQGYKKLYLGLSDEDNNVMAATLILEQEKNKFKIGYAPGGFLIDFTNLDLLKNFTNTLKSYLDNKKYVYLRLNPHASYKIFDKYDNIIYFNDNLINDMKNLGYQHLGFNNTFDRFPVVLITNSNTKDIYNSFNYNTKRNINKASLRGISIHKGNQSNIDLFYSFMRKKDKTDIEEYKDYFKYFNNHNNKFELYFAKIDPKTYINNYRYLLKEEDKKNDELNNLMQDMNVIKTISLINKKMTSDKKITSYNNEIIKATDLYRKYPDGIVIGTIGILRNNREVYFLYEASDDNFKQFYSSYLIKWEVMKKYLNEGYTIFNLGNISPNRGKDNNPYYGLYLSKIGFNANIYELPGEFDLVINKILYKVFTTFKNK